MLDFKPLHDVAVRAVLLEELSRQGLQLSFRVLVPFLGSEEDSFHPCKLLMLIGVELRILSDGLGLNLDEHSMLREDGENKILLSPRYLLWREFVFDLIVLVIQLFLGESHVLHFSVKLPHVLLQFDDQGPVSEVDIEYDVNLAEAPFA